jgi:hypothetical protein
LAPTDGEAARIIRQTNAGVVVSSTDVQAIEEAIWDLYQSHHDVRLVSKVDSSAIEEFDRKKQTAMLAAIFDELLGANNVGSKED